jgi:lysozyme
MSIKPDYQKLFAIKKHFEGFRHNAYRDSGGVWTIGFGNTFNFSKNRKVRAGDYITEIEGLEFMKRQAANVVREVDHYINRPLTPDQATAIVDYVYNRGIGNFLRTQLDELINRNPNDPAIRKEILGTGLRDRAGNLLWGLGRRRRAQAHLYFTGGLKFDWPRWG